MKEDIWKCHGYGVRSVVDVCVVRTCDGTCVVKCTRVSKVREIP